MLFIIGYVMCGVQNGELLPAHLFRKDFHKRIARHWIKSRGRLIK